MKPSHEDPDGRSSIGERMEPLSRWLVGRFADVPARRRRAAYGILEGWVSIILNTALFGVKLALGLMTGSIALIADAAHTLADSATSAVLIGSALVSRRPPDAKHPFGHGRAESIATVVIAALLGVAAFELGKESLARVFAPAAVDASWLVIGIVLATAAIKEWLSQFALALGRASGNQAITADAWHHRSDVFATVIVAVGMAAARWDLAVVDGIIGLAVAILIAKVALDVARSAVDTLLGERPTPEEIEEVRRCALEVGGVRSVHDVVIHKYGELTFVSVHVVTSDRLSAQALHQVAADVEARVARGGHGSVCVHVDPIDLAHPDYQRVAQLLRDMLGEGGIITNFHDLRVYGTRPGLRIEVDVKAPQGGPEPERVREQVVEAIRAALPGADVDVRIDPEYAY